MVPQVISAHRDYLHDGVKTTRIWKLLLGVRERVKKRKCVQQLKALLLVISDR